MKRLIKWIAIALFACVIIGIIAAIFGGGDKTSDTANQAVAPQATQQEQKSGTTTGQQEPTQQSKPTNTLKPTNTPKPQPSLTPIPSIGADIIVGKIRWKATAASVLGQVLKSNNQFIDDKTTSGKFVSVSYEVENRGSDQVYFQAPKLVDDQERGFSDYNEALFYIPETEQCILKQLNPNVPAVCTVIYEVAADAEQLKAQVTSLALLGGSPVLIDLGIKGQ